MDQIRFSLKLLLLLPPQSVISNAIVMTTLSGHFDHNETSETIFNEKLMEEAMISFPSPVLICEKNGLINFENKAAKELFEQISKDTENNTLIGQNYKTLFGNERFQGSCPDLDQQMSFTIHGIYQEGGKQKQFIDVSFKLLNNQYVIEILNTTQNSLYGQLIEEERRRSDILLGSILPPRLVQRVQNGEKTISFAIQSATIVFMDIIEFTPWCSSNSAAMVMSTLNKLFNEFDIICSSKATMTKIKCIGDCYMAAGGLFMIANQPIVHAREVVEFGIEAIKALIKVNEELNLDRKIRVGINTGGPITGGVIGSGKPTFEIIGSPINVGQQMEHHGVPMQVHISESTYEMISDGRFSIKKRGQINIKQGTAITYLIDPDQN